MREEERVGVKEREREKKTLKPFKCKEHLYRVLELMALKEV